VQLPYGLPCWVSARGIRGSRMIEVDVYYFYWLSGAVCALGRVVPHEPLLYCAPELSYARTALEGMNGEMARAFPRTAEHAVELINAINSVLPQVGEPVPNLNEPLPDWQANRIRLLATNIAAVLRDESRHGYILTVEDQRCLSSYTLVEHIENCFSKESWDTIGNDAKKEFEECGKCLSFERYTASGFHALRGVECVIRQYIAKLTGMLPDPTKKRDWGFYIGILKDKGADDKLVAVLDNMRSLDRNPLMHPDDWLEIDDAIAIFTTSQSAVARLAAGIKAP
jgi:hypothetical protein